MKIFATISLILFTSIFYSQNKFVLENYIIKVKPIKSEFTSKVCDTADFKSVAVVLEFDVIKEDDIKRFGNKIYAMDICYDYPGEGVFNGKEIWDLKVSEIQYYCWNINIINDELLDKNTNKEKFWIKDLSKKISIYCGPAKE